MPDKREPQPITWPVVAALAIVCITIVAVVAICVGWTDAL